MVYRSIQSVSRQILTHSLLSEVIKQRRIKNKMFKAIQIQTITGCTRSCSWCPEKPKRKNKMKQVMFDNILVQLKELNYKGRISPYLMNEPFLDDRMGFFIETIKKELPDCLMMINTNGDNKVEVIKHLDKIDEIRVNAYDEKTFKEYESMADIDNVTVVPMYKPENRAGFYNRAGHVGVEHEGRNYCERPFDQMYIDYLGRAILCCSDYKKEVVLGDLRKQTLKEIWEGEPYEHYRKELRDNGRGNLKLCDKCNY